MPSPPEWLDRLTVRERQVFNLVGDGASYAAVGSELGISPHTARLHAWRIRQKLTAYDHLPQQAAIVQAYHDLFADDEA